ncbi:DUF4397 domain-containing protein [Pseudomarimonas salicorniae]|uniref:DUF4397 domain-containing protein n=1 Tax=Pseudomarimonas salicorniae TaxID=2933270 RepID=A0ABT0GEV7_9GAMM|nr:DUF4397 domain-containing protein [Lysobacter sp. CAU 1642]MCK7592694.1 DUF4397 domain-containing protein [Lysobacter sp. CAU 1642]
MRRRFARKALSAAVSLLALPSLALADARVLVGHFAPFDADLAATAVDVRVNGQVALSNVRYGDFTDYLSLPAGATLVEVLPAGTGTVAISATLTLVDNTDYTVLATGGANGQPLALQALQDDNSAPSSGNLKLRVIHAAPFAGSAEATAVSIRTDRGAVVGGLASVPFFAASPYLEIPAGPYDLKVSTPDGARNLIDLAPVELPAGAVLSVLATGDGVNQPLGFTALPLGALPTELPVDISVSGHWFTPEFNGQGFAFTPKPDENRLLGSWYSWGDNGSQVWFALDSAGPSSGSDAPNGGFDNQRAVFTLYRSSGGAFASSQAVVTEPAGTVTVEFADCLNAVASYAFEGGPSGEIPLTNLTPSGVCTLPQPSAR